MCCKPMLLGKKHGEQEITFVGHDSLRAKHQILVQRRQSGFVQVFVGLAHRGDFALFREIGKYSGPNLDWNLVHCSVFAMFGGHFCLSTDRKRDKSELVSLL